jgi:hypothetical protein
LHSLTARDANARNLGEVLDDRPHHHQVEPGDIPTSDEVPGPANGAAAVCSASSVQSVSPAPVSRHHGDHSALVHPLARSGWPTGSGMAGLGKELKKRKS